MHRTLHGLTVALTGNDPADGGAHPDIRWHRRVVDALPPEGRACATTEDRADGSWTIHVYADAERTHQRFAISPDGTRVESVGIAITPDHEIWGLIAEPVMRTIFRLRGIPSLHAAALTRDGRTILIVGDKGAGKSTLSAGLVRNGWTLLSDDLSRVERIGGRWCAHAGYNQLKLRLDTMAALGIEAGELQWRWREDDPDPGRLEGNKMVWRLPEAAVRDPRPIDEILLLQPRGVPLAEPRRERTPAAPAMLALQPHLTSDPFLAETAPRREAMEALLSLSASVACTALTMPADLQRLVEHARTV
jgi:hypothetical protein